MIINLSILSNLQITISNFSLFGDRQKEVDGMNDHGSLTIHCRKLQSSAAVHYALREILTFMAKADSDRQVSLAFATMDLMRERMHRFSSAKS